MLSILVPVYNYDVSGLCGELVSQCSKAGIDYEIIFADDCSPDTSLVQSNLGKITAGNARYTVLKENLGRAKIRNFLAKEAKGQWLLFLDCDSMPCEDNFIATYLRHIDASHCVICGGTKYKDRSTVTKEYFLHWKNGKNREEGRKHFTTNNFLIRKDVFNAVEFDSSLKGYGHEDTVFGEQLKQKGFSILHIDNCVYHLGLKTTDKFISDTVNAEKNLRKLYNNPSYTDLLGNLSIIRAYKKLEKYRLTALYKGFVRTVSGCIDKQLHSNRPILRLLDIYKLYFFIQ
ncbi:MAG: glycosyltransferase [Bacteroidales bacterium]|nr:glycosyltransferase [Bacteroidales bacterium]